MSALWLAPAALVLASRSKVRRALLETAGIPVEVRPATLDERAVEARSPDADPAAVAAVLAREKALRVAAELPGRLVVGADQTLALGSRRFSKPADRAGAISEAFLERYLDAAGPAVTASVGGYQLEALGIELFETIDGDHFTILGLPLLPLLAYLRAEGSLAA